MNPKEEELISIKKKIKERELNSQNLPLLVHELLELTKKYPKSGVPYELLAEVYYQMGEESEIYNLDKQSIIWGVSMEKRSLIR